MTVDGSIELESSWVCSQKVFVSEMFDIFKENTYLKNFVFIYMKVLMFNSLRKGVMSVLTRESRNRCSN